MSKILESKLSDEITYNFEHLQLEEDDKLLETNVYKINIFENDYLIAMGKKRTNIDDENIIYFIAYLLYNLKVVSKIGVYELDLPFTKEQTNNATNFDFTTLDINLFDDYYNDTQLLAPYKFSLENTNNDDKIVINGTIKLTINKNSDLQEALITELQNLILIPDKEKKYSYITFFYQYLSDIKSSTDDDDLKKEISAITKLNSGTWKYTKKDKKTLKDSIVYSVLKNKGLVLDIYNLIVLEYMLDAKFIIIDDNILYFNVVPQNKNIIISEISKKRSNYKNFNPNNVIFLRKIKNTYYLIKYNNNIINDFNNLEDSLLILIYKLYLKGNHEYSVDSQFEYMKSIISSKNINSDKVNQVSEIPNIVYVNELKTSENQEEKIETELTTISEETRTNGTTLKEAEENEEEKTEASENEEEKPEASENEEEEAEEAEENGEEETEASENGEGEEEEPEATDPSKVVQETSPNENVKEVKPDANQILELQEKKNKIKMKMKALKAAKAAKGV